MLMSAPTAEVVQQPFLLTMFHMSKPIQANLSAPATSLTEENGRIRQVAEIDRLEKYMEKFNRLGFLARLDRKSE